MKKDKNSDHNNYYEGIRREQKNKKSNDTNKHDFKNKEKAKKNEFQKIGYLNNEYFPEAQAILEDSSIQSSRTTKIRNNSPSTFNGFRPKLSNKSLNASERSTRKQLQNQISKLTNQLLTKDKALMKRHSFQRVKQSEMSQLYRIINFYQGKIKYLEDQIKRYQQVLQKIGRQSDEKSKHQTQMQQLVNVFEQIRNQNLELSAKLEEKDYNFGIIENKNRKLQLKVNFFKSKNSYLKQMKGENYDMSSKFSNSSQKKRLDTAIQLKQRKQKYGNMQSKIYKIQSNLNFLKKENQNLQLQLQRKQEKIHYLLLQLGRSQKSMYRQQSNKKLQIQQKDAEDVVNCQNAKLLDENKNRWQARNAKQMINNMNNLNTYDKMDPLNRLMQLPGALFVREEQKEIKQSQKQINKRIIKNESKSQRQRLIEEAKKSRNMVIFKKLKYQLLTEEVSHDELIKFLISQDIQPQLLQQSPYNLKEDQAQWLVQWVQSISDQSCSQGIDIQQVLKAVIPKYDNLTLRKQNDLKIQIANQALNREHQWNITLSQKSNFTHIDLQQYFKEWGLGQSHVDALGKSHYEETGQIECASLHVVGQLLEKWGKK